MNKPPHKRCIIYKVGDEHMLSSMLCQWRHNDSLLETIVPQLVKYLDFWHSQGLFCIRQSDFIPRIDLNFRHLSCKLCNKLFILQELLRSKTFFEQEIT